MVSSNRATAGQDMDRENMDREDMDREDMDREDMDRATDMDREDMDRATDMDREDMLLKEGNRVDSQLTGLRQARPRMQTLSAQSHLRYPLCFSLIGGSQALAVVLICRR